MKGFSLGTTWLDALTLFLRGEEHGIFAKVDYGGRLLMSGYALLDAGLISTDCKITCALRASECTEHYLGMPPQTCNAIELVLHLYVNALKNAKDDVSLLHRSCAIAWLAANGSAN